MDTKFQKWLIEHQPEDKMLWEKSFWDTYIFWRDRIIPMFNTVERSWKDYENTTKDIDTFTDVVGAHWSKSILNPVLKIIYKGITIVFRYNFYDYEIAVIGYKEIHIPMKGLFSSENVNFYFQGFPEEYQLKERYEINKCKFMASLGNHFQFFTFMFLLKAEIDRVVKVETRITDETIGKLEYVFGFSLHDWQKRYLKGKVNTFPSGRGGGKTLAYCIRLLLGDHEPFNPYNLSEINTLVDECHGAHYTSWFCRYIQDLNNQLLEAGFSTNAKKRQIERGKYEF